MNKNIIALSLMALIGANASAQLPKWLIEPLNDTIFVKIDNKVLQSEANGNSYLWTMDGKEIFSTNEKILPFNEGVAPIQSNTTQKIVGFVDDKGNFTQLPNLPIEYGDPNFHDGLLLSKVQGAYMYFNKEGKTANFDYIVKAYPFHQGYAPYFTYDNIEKLKDPHYGYFTPDNHKIQYTIWENGKNKPLQPLDIDFLSSIGSNGKGIGIIKEKYYWFDPDTKSFEPILRGGDDLKEKQKHLKVSANFERYLQNLPNDTITLRAKYGKNSVANLKFDERLNPLSITFEDGEMDFAVTPPLPYQYKSNVAGYGDDSYGLSFNGEEIVPEQFDEVGLAYDNNVLVKKNNKWGVIEIIPDIDYSVMVNKGEDVAFRHQKFETQLRLDLPAQISAKNARVNIDEETGLILDRTSRESKDTESGNFVTYDCVLNIPLSLPNTISTITYAPLKVSYDDIVMFDRPLRIKAWHLKYYNVDPIDSETAVNDGVVSFTIDINAQRMIGESDYPFEVKFESDSLSIDYEKLSETRYKCTVSNLAEGPNDLNIVLTEKGCPPSSFPFDIIYTKPKGKIKEEVEVRKKAPSEAKAAPMMEL